MSTSHTAAYSDALVVLGTAGVVIPLVRRWGLSPVLGYLGAGALLGPLGLGSLTGAVPGLFWVTITDAQNVAGIAELGVVFLLFLIGLELSFSRLSAMRRLVLGLGGLQVLLTSAVIAGAALALSRSPSEAIVLGSALSLSSTAIVLELLSESGAADHERGSGKLLHSAGAGSRRHSDPALHFDSRHALRRFGARKPRHRAVAGRRGDYRHRRLRTCFVASAVPAWWRRRVQPKSSSPRSCSSSLPTA